MTHRLVVLLALAGLASCGSPRGTTGPGGGAGASKGHAMQELDDALAQARQDSRSHFSIDTLPARQRLAAAAAAAPRAWKQRPPLDQFFLFVVSPDAAAQAGRQLVARAYGAALESLIADWWGLPGSVRTDAASQFVALGADAEPVFLDLLGRDAPLTYDDGEANTLARRLGLQVADLAAGLLAAIRGQRYDWRADANTRRGAREHLQAAARLIRSRHGPPAGRPGLGCKRAREMNPGNRRESASSLGLEVLVVVARAGVVRALSGVCPDLGQWRPPAGHSGHAGL